MKEVITTEEVRRYVTDDGKMTYRFEHEAISYEKRLWEHALEGRLVTMEIFFPFDGMDETWTEISDDQVLKYFNNEFDNSNHYINNGSGALKVGDWVVKIYRWEHEEWSDPYKSYHSLWTLEYFKKEYLIPTMLKTNRILAEGWFNEK